MARLSKQNWIEAGFRALTMGGIAAINIEKIAIDLSVSKGSFYWHFKNLAAYKTAMMDHWEAAGTKNIIEKSTISDLSAHQQLKGLVHVISNTDTKDYGGNQVEVAIRNWGRFEPEINVYIVKVDQLRLEFLTKLFKAICQNDGRASQSARILYGTYVGLEALAVAEQSSLHADLDKLLDALLRQT